MEELRVGLEAAQVVVFLGVAVAALRVWWQQRSRPAALLMAAFGVIGLTLLTNRTFPADGEGAGVPLVRDLVIVGLAAFPWLLAMFAWSFEPRLPRWLLAAGGVVPLFGVWALWLPATAFGPRPRSASATAFVISFIAVWVLLAGTAAVRLWWAGDTQPLVRARMRLMSGGALVLAAALLIAGSVPPDAYSVLPMLITTMTILSALLFVAGFAPPRPLRVWWRGRITSAWQQMQLDLIAAGTAEEAAGAVAPVVAELLGGGVAIFTDDGGVLAVARIPPTNARQVVAGLVAGQAPAPGDEVVEIGSVSMMICPTAYTPLFGQDERDLVSAFAGQLRLALDRVELFSAEERARLELQRARDEEQGMIMGLAHDLRGSSNTLGGYTSLLRTSKDDAEREEIMHGIEASSSHLEELVASLLELGRVGAKQPRSDAVQLGRVVGEVVARLKPVHPEIDFRCTVDLPVMVGDRLELGQVFENLFLNAIRHGGPDIHAIVVSGDEHDGTITIDLRDDGQGIAPADRAAVFSLFHRGRSGAGHGSGVGLNLVRRIVEAHRGTIELVDGDAGAHFRLCFPLPPQPNDRDLVVEW